jgi:hypothetical protein
MTGITLSSEQIRNAPADVRRWIEREVLTAMSQSAPFENGGKPHGGHLAACSEEEITAILSHIQGVLPAVNVFFEFGRQGAVFGQPNIEAFRLLDIAHHTRLQNVGQVVACLDIINQAYGRVCGDMDARFCGFDHDGHCFVTLETQQNILKVWRKVIASQQIALDQSEFPKASRPNGEAPLNRATEGASLRQAAIEDEEAAPQFTE